MAGMDGLRELAHEALRQQPERLLEACLKVRLLDRWHKGPSGRATPQMKGLREYLNGLAASQFSFRSPGRNPEGYTNEVKSNAKGLSDLLADLECKRRTGTITHDDYRAFVPMAMRVMEQLRDVEKAILECYDHLSSRSVADSEDISDNM